MSLQSGLKPFCNWVYNRYAGEQGKMLIHTGVVGWMLSAAAQVCAIVVNDNIPKEQKKFLIPQELADAAINIVSFYAVTSTVKNLACKLVSTGKIASKPVRKFLNDNNLAKTHVGKLSFDIKNLPNFDKISDSYNSFKGGADMIGTTVGSVLSCNIITPVLRNKYASHYQKKSLELDKNTDNRTIRPRGITLDEFRTATNHSGSMRI